MPVAQLAHPAERQVFATVSPHDALPVITLPDGSVREFPGPVTRSRVAASIGPGLAKAALAGRVDDELVDTVPPIEATPAVASSPTRTPTGWK